MNAFLFVLLLALTSIFCFAVALVASHYFLVVAEATAAGNQKVELPEEPVVDWFWKPFYMGILCIVWGAPAFLIGWGIGGNENHALSLTLVIVWMWLFFPIGMLSSLSAASRWTPLWLGLFPRMAQRPAQVGRFYVLSLPVLGAFAISFYMLIVRKTTGIELVFLLAPLAAAAFLLYARLLGRMGLVLLFTKGREDLRPKRRRPKPHPAVVTPILEDDDEATGPRQPSELPGVMTPYDGEITGYDVDFSGNTPQPTPEPPRQRIIPDDDDDAEPIRVADPVPVLSERCLTLQQEKALQPPSKEEMELYDHSERVVREPKRPFGSECFAFLLQPDPMSMWIELSLALFVLGAFIAGLRALRPG